MSLVFDPRKVRGKDLSRITDLDSLETACRKLGLVFRRGDPAYHTWNDKDPNKVAAEHTISLGEAALTAAMRELGLQPSKWTRPYDIGVIRSDEDDCWYLTSDNDPTMTGAKLLASVCGPIRYEGANDADRTSGVIVESFGLLMQRYFVDAQLAAAVSMGYAAYEELQPDGSISVAVDVPEYAAY